MAGDSHASSPAPVASTEDPAGTAKPLAGYQRRTQTLLAPKEFIDHERAMSDIGMREKMVDTLLRTYTLLIAATVVIFLLQGFKIGGFSLPNELLHWLGAATVGEVGGLAALVYGSLFRKAPSESNS